MSLDESSRRNRDVVMMLLDTGSNVNAADMYGKNPLQTLEGTWSLKKMGVLRVVAAV